MGEERPCDYDARPERFRLARAVQRRHAAAGDVHGLVGRRFLAAAATPVLDVGCGEGELARHLPEDAWVGVDASATMLAPELVAERFVDVDAWDLPLLTLPTPESVRDYLVGRQVAPDRAAAVAGTVDTPLRVTKRGALVYARKAQP